MDRETGRDEVEEEDTSVEVTITRDSRTGVLDGRCCSQASRKV